MEIRVLDGATINKIAAGEVIERPLSIVKELVENSIDAGADAITVEIKGGGIDFIRVTDNGSGIDAGQVRTAFLPHATSKIRSAEDLFDIRSLGFRGEALSTVAAVSRVEMITKVHSHLTGDMRGNLMTILQLHAEHGIGECFNDLTVLLDSGLFCHTEFLSY